VIIRGAEARERWAWQNFTPTEFACRHCGGLLVDTELMDRLAALRLSYGAPMKVNSGYRCPTHNNAVSGTGLAGPHTRGAVDIAVTGRDAHRLLGLAALAGVRGIGVNQKGPHAGRFVHFDMLPDATAQPRPWVWTY
jgi:zinc D-Ala-D-Ala carboxypeptidase